MLKVGGFTPLSTTDWPDKLAAVVFIQGCPWRCHYCHNPELQTRRDLTQPGHGGPDWHSIMQTLARRQGLLDGVVFSGGEPTLDPALPDAMAAVRALGFSIGLHTAGIYPTRLRDVLPLIDWIGFDLKTTFEGYPSVTAIEHSGSPVQDSFAAILAERNQRKLQIEVRTTYHPRLQSDADMRQLARLLQASQLDNWVIQPVRPVCTTHVEQGLHHASPSTALLDEIRQQGIRLTVR